MVYADSPLSPSSTPTPLSIPPPYYIEMPSGAVLTRGREVAVHVASSITIFAVTSTLFFTVGFLCRHSVCRKQKRTEISTADEYSSLQRGITQNGSKQQNLEFDLSSNVAYASVR